METIVVTAAIIKRDNRYLIAQRKKGAHQGSLWEFPGGKVEAGEEPRDCLKREIAEELNINIDVAEIYEVVSHNYGQRHIILLCYQCRLVNGQPQPVDCQDFTWVTVAEMNGYEFAPADIPVVEKLQADGTTLGP